MAYLTALQSRKY